ncbi:hypothetical protein [Mesobacillus subterraneus]|uniref:Uncharacterized protein n=1 Tax=Mesobacillus subterraneus TaxID=285983 RepID=A0A0D6Z7F5_9BACI|nr:hypothetical protein [Mesobacillus subterraneus]KIY21719.1 hypothetical protein UB32_12500 [Mesobacillus subterraneus]
MSKEKPGKEIHVDQLTIYAKEVKIIHDVEREQQGERRHPFAFYGPRKSQALDTDEDHERKEESNSDVGEEGEERKGFRWL